MKFVLVKQEKGTLKCDVLGKRNQQIQVVVTQKELINYFSFDKQSFEI